MYNGFEYVGWLKFVEFKITLEEGKLFLKLYGTHFDTILNEYRLSPFNRYTKMKYKKISN